MNNRKPQSSHSYFLFHISYLRRERSFTLIELLVVISIIAILASMMLPAIKSAQENAKGAQCMSNMKQVCLYTIQYTSAYGDYYPVSNFRHASGNPHYAMQILHRTIFPEQVYRFADRMADGYGNDKGKAKNEYVKGNIVCPKVITKYPYGTGTSENSYGANGGVMGSADDSNPASVSLNLIKSTQVRFPAKAYIWGEKGARIIEAHKTGTELVQYRHNAQVTMGFADGHAQLRKRFIVNRGAVVNGSFSNGARWFYNGKQTAD